MNDVVGVIAEFNPFHSGHKYLFDRIREDLGGKNICCVMSGDFIQRGGPAVFDKWKRSEEAVEGGADLVLELPAVYAASSAGIFAEGGIAILEGLGIVDTIAFGSESGDVAELKEAADIINMIEEDKVEDIRAELAKGISYPRAREEVFKKFHDGKICNSGIIREPNNILAIEYLRRTGLPAFTVKRNDEGHSERATEIREKFRRENPEIFRRSEEKYFDLVRSQVLKTSAEELDNLASAGEGLGNKLKNNIRYSSSLDDLISMSVSKRYTETRIRRLLGEAVLGIDAERRSKRRPYIKVLAYNDRGADILRRIKKNNLATIPILDSYGKTLKEASDELRETIELDILASDIFNLINGNDLYENSDWVRKPVYVEME